MLTRLGEQNGEGRFGHCRVANGARGTKCRERSGTNRNAHGSQLSFLLNHPSPVVHVAAMEDVPGADGEDGTGVDDEEDLAVRPPSRSHEGR